MKILDRLKEHLPVTRKQLLELHRDQARMDQYLMDYISFVIQMQNWTPWHLVNARGPKPPKPKPPIFPGEDL